MITLAVAGVLVLVGVAAIGVHSTRPRVPHRSLLSTTHTPLPGPAPAACVSKRTCPGVITAEHSILRITTTAPSCHRTINGTGFVYAPDHILTDAHVVAGAAPHGISVTDFTGSTHRATLVGYDPERDLAVLDVSHLSLAALEIATGPGPPAQGVTAGYSKGRALVVQGVGILPPRQVYTNDIYGRTFAFRKILKMRATIDPGESGSPVLDRDGRVIGLVFARELDVPNTGYATSATEIRPRAETDANATAPVSAQGCPK